MFECNRWFLFATLTAESNRCLRSFVLSLASFSNAGTTEVSSCSRTHGRMYTNNNSDFSS